MVKTWPPNAGSAGSIPVWGHKIPHCLEAKTPKHKTEAILKQIQYTLKMIHIQKKNLKKKNIHEMLSSILAAMTL